MLRDALSDLLAEEAQYGPVVDERGAVAGVLSIEILSHALQDRPGEVPSGADAAAMSPLLAQVRDPRAHARHAASPDNGFCPDWIADNFDRYVDPLLRSTC